ncbi:tRNA N(3)-methylcytidine methyltransferase METTL2 isoform X2 [Folsomia candida]|nr:tRNA N(3)-methylcytidine methyltransferase METTL2 isoform X2 [Folsomia candida]XP_035709295.1 tRNA N(3)-methylcytidine methyltransferase METTL2 isoform X2 [Folsomia candida]XP_035709296.1 tRNA N(3)-methylcytidine methyltransferase METTL2 isoform X2 [Folsomia candida]
MTSLNQFDLNMDNLILESTEDNLDDSVAASEHEKSVSLKKELDEQDRLRRTWEEIKNKNEGTASLMSLPDEVKFVVKVRNRHLKDANAVYDCNAWDDVEWDSELEEQARNAVEKNSAYLMEVDKRYNLERNADSNWDKFYSIHQNKFFRDRNWLFIEFPELKSPFGSSVSEEESMTGITEKRKSESYPGENSGFKVLEIGCGVGNTVFPFLAANNHPETYVYCCDFSSTAVDIIKGHEKFQPTRCTPFVLDITSENPITPFPKGSLDVITAIFVISAISPDKYNQVIRNLLEFLKPGGIILFRDYGRYDMAQLRFKDGRCISENFYMRGDGTRVYFFLEDEVEKLFLKQGFTKERIIVDKRLQVNRSRQLKMYRVWIQAKFVKPS